MVSITSDHGACLLAQMSLRIPKKEVQCLHVWQAGNPKVIRHLSKSLENNSKYQGHQHERMPSLGKANISSGIPWPSAVRGLANCFVIFAFKMVFTVNNRKHFYTFQIVPASVVKYMLITTQHYTESKADSTANTTVI